MRVHQGLTVVMIAVTVTAASVVTGGSASDPSADPSADLAADPAADLLAAAPTDSASVNRDQPARAPSRLPSIRLRQRSAASPGAPVTYLIEVRNPGAEPLPNVMVHQLLSPGLGYRNARPEPAAVSQEQLRWQVSLSPGQTVRLRTRGQVSVAGTSFWNHVGIGDQPRVGTTTCVAPTAHSAVSGCDTALAEAVVAVPWWRTWYALVGYALIAIVGVAAGIVWFRRRRSAH